MDENNQTFFLKKVLFGGMTPKSNCNSSVL